MTKQEMIRGLNRILAEYEYELDQIDREALDMAIDALEQLSLPRIIIRQGEQEPKRGKWKMHPEGKFVGFPYVHYECSECRAFVPEDTEYCPHCGARMESDTE